MFRRKAFACHQADARATPLAMSEATSGFRLSRHSQLDFPAVASLVALTISGHGLDQRPVLPEERRGLENVRRLHVDAASLSSAIDRNLKMERVGLRAFVGRLAFAAHLVSPLRASSRDT